MSISHYVYLEGEKAEVKVAPFQKQLVAITLKRRKPLPPIILVVKHSEARALGGALLSVVPHVEVT